MRLTGKFDILVLSLAFVDSNTSGACRIETFSKRGHTIRRTSFEPRPREMAMDFKASKSITGFDNIALTSESIA